MGRRWLMVQTDLTSEEDLAFLACVRAKLSRRRLAEDVTGQAGAAKLQRLVQSF